MRKEDWDWDSLRAYVGRDMVRAGLNTQEQLADAMPNFTLRALSDFMTGKSTMRATNLGKLEVALGWKPGSAKDILEGREPRYVEKVAANRGEPRDGASPRWQSYRVTADESLNLLTIALRDYGPGGFWRAFDEIIAGRETIPNESSADHASHSA